MAVSVKVGTFATGTGTTTVNSGSLGFAPVAVFLFSNGRGTPGSGTASFALSAGFSVSGGDCAATLLSVEGGASGDAQAGRHATASGTTINASAVHDGIGQCTLNADDFDFTISDAFTADIDFIWLALGGDVSVANVASPTYSGSTGIEAVVTGLAYQPKAALFLVTNAAATGTATASGYNFTLGCTTGTAAGENWVVGVGSQTGTNPSNTARYGLTGECIASVNPGATIATGGRGVLSSFNSDGLSVNFTEAGTAGREFHVITLGGAADFLAGSFNARADVTQTAVTTTGQNPKALLLVSANMAASTADAVTASAAMSIGVATSSTARHCVAGTDEDAVTPIDGWTSYHSDAVYARGDFADAEVGIMDIAELGTGTGQFEFVMDDADPDANAVVFFLAIGDSATSTTGVKMRRRRDAA